MAGGSGQTTGACPAQAILPGATCSRGQHNKFVAAAAREKHADGSVDPEVIGAALIHAIEHNADASPELGLAIRDITPWLSRQGAEAIRPLVDADAGTFPNQDMLKRAITLALLDPGAAEIPADLLRRTRGSHITVLVCRWYARISSAHREEVAARLLAEAPGEANGQLRLACVQGLVDLGPEYFPAALAAADAIFAGGQTVGVLHPLSDLDPGFLPDAVAIALRSLRADPGGYLPSDQWHGWHTRILPAIGELPDPGFHRLLAGTLEQIVADETVAAEHRWRAAKELAGEPLAAAVPGAHQRAVALLTGAGTADPNWQPSGDEAWELVNQAWDRIEAALRVSAPHLLDKLGPPATREEARLCQEVFGLPDVAGACVARHRYNWIRSWSGGGRAEIPVNNDLYYEDVVGVLDACRNPGDGTYDVSDPGDLSDFLFDPGWLTALTRWADQLEADDRQS